MAMAFASASERAPGPPTATPSPQREDCGAGAGRQGVSVTHKVRVVTLEGHPWFVAADVLEVLGLIRGGRTLSCLADDEFRTVLKRVIGSHHFAGRGNPWPVRSKTG